MHCADAIDESLIEMKSILDKLQDSDEKAGKRLGELVASSAEAVNIITSCSSHQKRYAIGIAKPTSVSSC